jgi:hypothetical protein
MLGYMNEIENKSELSQFIKKRRKPTSLEITKPVTHVTQEKLPWYKRPLERTEFTSKMARNGNYYIRHKEWGKGIWIGPYTCVADVEKVITSYLVESLKQPLDRKVDNNVHSLTIDNEEEFFYFWV